MISYIEINLLPAEYRIHKRQLRLDRKIFYPVLLDLIVLVGIWLWTVTIDSQIKTTRNDIAVVDSKIRENATLEEEITRLNADMALIEGKIVALRRISVNREKWVRLLEVMSRNCPDYTWLVAMEEKDSLPPSLAVEGRTYSFPEVANYMSLLKQSDYINDVTLINIEQVDQDARVFRFQFVCIVNPDAGL